MNHSVEILSVGTELLLGDIVNTDAAYLARRLSEMGIPVYRQSVVGDNADRLLTAIDEAFSRSDTVILTGGLGPTCDDITKEITARYFGVDLMEDAESLTRMQAYFAAAGRTMTENNYKQCLTFEGGTVFQNDRGTAPGVAIRRDGKTAILLPGPPSELIPMFENSVVPYLSPDGVMYSLNLHLTEIGESAAEQILRPLMEQSENPTVAPYAGEDEVRIRITARAESRAEAERMCREMKETVLSYGMRDYLYAETDTPEAASDAAAHALIGALQKKGWRMAAAESCTGGMIGNRITAVSGASEVFSGSMVTYTNETKMRALGVREETLSTYDAVSEETAREMAKGALRMTDADIAVSVTGIAGPGGGTEDRPVGTVCFGLCIRDEEPTSVTVHFNPRASREKIRRQAASHAMRMVLGKVRGGEKEGKNYRK
ncbi:MAG: competence/damage-inducible protein A [Clostridia bacterium]|nr:competence/damage-inducible protein A [Clostridia bacterium]